MNTIASGMGWQILHGDAVAMLRTLNDGTVNTCVTSPPYFGLRDYGVAGQIGLEPTPDQYVSKMVEVFREVRRVLRDDGTLWLNLGDSYGSTGGNIYECSGTPELANGGINFVRPGGDQRPKNLLGIPWRVAFALQADGWYLRQDIIWHKPNPMPESVRDRCTKAHEYIFLLAKSERYHFDSEAMKEEAITGHNGSNFHTGKTGEHQLGRASKQPRFGGVKYGESDDPKYATKSGNEYKPTGTRNRRSVWSVATRPYKGAHFATYPPELIRPCVLAGCPVGGLVLDPFNGSGTTGAVAVSEGRNYVGIELNAEYIKLAHERIGKAEVLR